MLSKELLPLELICIFIMWGCFFFFFFWILSFYWHNWHSDSLWLSRLRLGLSSCLCPNTTASYGSHRVLSNTFYFTSTELLHAVCTLFGYTTLSWQCALNFDPLGGISVLEYKYVVLGKECAFICHWAVGCLCSLNFVYICVTHRDVCDDPPLCSGLLVRILDVVGHPGIFGRLNLFLAYLLVC